MSELPMLSVLELSSMIARRDVSPLEVIRSFLARIDAFEAGLHHYISIARHTALDRAQSLEEELDRGQYRGPLHGIPVVHKDVIDTIDLPTTAHSRALDDECVQADAAVVRRLESAGMILLGKTNTNEFANGGTPIYETPRNPWDVTRFTGGSSAGSGGGVAAGTAIAATGSDTGGSIRAPASFCGIVGLKPTHGLVDTGGLIPLSWSMDNIGPMTRTVADNAVLLGAMVGMDAVEYGVAFAPGRQSRLEGVTVGIPQNHFFETLHPEVDTAVRRAVEDLEQLGCEMIPVALPGAGDLKAAGSIIVAVEAYARHADRLRRVGDSYGVRARRRLATGAFFSAADYAEALQVREEWMRTLNRAMSGVDVLATPTQRILAPTIEEEEMGPPDTSWGTRHFNFSGHPAISLPCGFSRDGLPIGLQLVGHHHEERALLQVAHVYERAAEWYRRRPDPRGWKR